MAIRSTQLEVDALLTGEPIEVLRYVLTELKETKQGVADLTEICKQRERECPLKEDEELAEGLKELPKVRAKMWVLWGGAVFLSNVAVQYLLIRLTTR